ncbi:MAG: Stp1/IreP family PP2C-type Ser/Thr phosphatase [Eubacteriales bacterium]|nr:Stp1/IreP family PP2C-type Ser/Thr phosphatase [Eubacteriales bacterium]
MNTACSTNCGLRRERNEDSLIVFDKEKVLLIADGVGGANSGEVASRLCVSSIGRYFKKYPLPQSRDIALIRNYFRECLKQVNDLVYQASLSKKEYEGMATTLVALILGNHGTAFAINVGDSRLYLLREGVLHQITEDHTYVNEMVRQGIMTEEQAKLHENRYMITRAVGAEETIDPDFYEVEIQAKDLFLLCSDGLYEEVPENRIRTILDGTLSLDEKAERLTGEALEYGGLDNISSILAQITEEDCI